MTGGMLFNVSALTKTYLSYPVKVDVSVKREKQIVFPAVTVCNMSPVKKSALDAPDMSRTSERRKKRSATGSCKRVHCHYLQVYPLTPMDCTTLPHSKSTTSHCTPSIIIRWRVSVDSKLLHRLEKCQLLAHMWMVMLKLLMVNLSSI